MCRTFGGKGDFMGPDGIGIADHEFTVRNDAVNKVINLLAERVVGNIGTVRIPVSNTQ